MDRTACGLVVAGAGVVLAWAASGAVVESRSAPRVQEVPVEAAGEWDAEPPAAVVEFAEALTLPGRLPRLLVPGAPAVAADPAANETCQSQPACDLDGLCTAGPSGCRAAGDDCQSTWQCEAEGRCHVVGDRCVAQGEDCLESDACVRLGRCVIVGDGCEATSDIECRLTGACRSTADGCAALSDQDCAMSENCRTTGACLLDDHGTCLRACESIDSRLSGKRASDSRWGKLLEFTSSSFGPQRKDNELRGWNR